MSTANPNHLYSILIFSDEEEAITVSQFIANASNVIVGGTNSKELQLLPRIAALLHILEHAFKARKHHAALDIPDAIPLITLQAAEQLLVTGSKQKQIFLEVFNGRYIYGLLLSIAPMKFRPFTQFLC